MVGQTRKRDCARTSRVVYKIKNKVVKRNKITCKKQTKEKKKLFFFTMNYKYDTNKDKTEARRATKIIKQIYKKINAIKPWDT